MSYEALIAGAEIIELRQPDIITELETVKFWFDTDVKTPLFLRCILFGYFIQQIFTGNKIYNDFGSQTTRVLIFESGYKWIMHLNWPLVYSLSITDWLRSFLSFLRDEQLLLLRRLDLHGIESKFTLNEKLLLYIVETNSGIKTTAISRKLGLSRATVKRMLSKLKEKGVIEARGINRGTYYKILL